MPDDAAALALIHECCFERPWGEDSFRKLLESSAAFGYLAKSSDTENIESFVIARTAADEGEILTLGTVPEARRKGLAMMLLDASMHEARLRGARRLFLEVCETNQAALELYASRGFHQTGKRLGYYVSTSGPAAGALILCRVLP